MRTLLFALSVGLVGFAVVFGLIGCAGEVAATDDGTQQDLKLLKSYLALGDSVAFGYNPDDYASQPYNIKAFNGYPEVISLAPIPVANASCEGETSLSFLNPAAPDKGCHEDRAKGYALHVTYASQAESQLQYALAFLKTHPTTATVSVGIGANDLLLLQDGCVAKYAPDPAAIGACIQAGALPTIQQTAANVGTILGAIRQSGYTGQLVVVTYYSLQYSDLSDLNLQSIYGLDTALVTVAQDPRLNASVAKGFTAFGAIAKVAGGGDSCKAGLLYQKKDGTGCDKHPSAFGQSVLAGAVAGAVPASSINLADPNVQF
jgi:hypothetical protein